MRFAIAGWLLVFCGISTAQVMHLNVVVRDGRSRIVRNLEPADFTVRENGADAIVRGVQPADPKQKYFVSLLFDPLSGEPAHLAREAAFELLNASAKSNVWFGVFEADQTLRVRRSFTADGKAVLKAVELTTTKKAAEAAEERKPEGEDDTSALTRSILRASATVA